MDHRRAQVDVDRIRGLHSNGLLQGLEAGCRDSDLGRKGQGLTRKADQPRGVGGAGQTLGTALAVKDHHRGIGDRAVLGILDPDLEVSREYRR